MDKKETNKEKINKGKETKDPDPQEKMEGPISSLMQNIKETAEENDEETKDDADKKKDKNT